MHKLAPHGWKHFAINRSGRCHSGRASGGGGGGGLAASVVFFVQAERCRWDVGGVELGALPWLAPTA